MTTHRWYTYLENALFDSMNSFDTAHRHCDSVNKKSFINHAHGHFFLDEKNFDAAAERFALQSVNLFEEVLFSNAKCICHTIRRVR